MEKYGLIGYPLGHSFSKSYFNQKFQNEGIDAVYENYEIPDISTLPEILDSNPELKGLNVTIPYKEQVIKTTRTFAADEESAFSFSAEQPFARMSISGFKCNHYPAIKATAAKKHQFIRIRRKVFLSLPNKPARAAYGTGNRQKSKTILFHQRGGADVRHQ